MFHAGLFVNDGHKNICLYLNKRVLNTIGGSCSQKSFKPVRPLVEEPQEAAVSLVTRAL